MVHNLFYIMNYGYVYKLTHIKSGKIYIGAKTGNKVNKSYYGSGSIWNKEIISKCNPDKDINREILQWCKNVNELNQAEQYWIDFYDSTNPNIGYNIQKGGNMPTSIDRQNMSNIIHNRMNDEYKQKISKGLKRQRQENGLSEAHRRHLSEALKGKKVGCPGDSRSIQVYCIVNNKQYTFHNKVQAAKWWFDNYPFSDTYAEITYTRAITKSINNVKITYKGKDINQSIKWYINQITITENDPIYCIYNNKKYNFSNSKKAILWWHKNYPIMSELDETIYFNKLYKNIKGFDITYKSITYNKIKWYRKETII